MRCWKACLVGSSKGTWKGEERRKGKKKEGKKNYNK